MRVGTYIIFVADAADIVRGAILLHREIVDGHVEQNCFPLQAILLHLTKLTHLSKLPYLSKLRQRQITEFHNLAKFPPPHQITEFKLHFPCTLQGTVF